MKTYSKLKRLSEWTEKFENQLLAGEQWDDKNYARWLSGEVNTNNKEDTVLPKKPKPGILGSVYFMYKYALFYSRKIFKILKSIH